MVQDIISLLHLIAAGSPEKSICKILNEGKVPVHDVDFRIFREIATFGFRKGILEARGDSGQFRECSSLSREDSGLSREFPGSTRDGFRFCDFCISERNAQFWLPKFPWVHGIPRVQEFSHLSREDGLPGKILVHQERHVRSYREPRHCA